MLYTINNNNYISVLDIQLWMMHCLSITGITILVKIIVYLHLFLPVASFLNAALGWSICAWILNKSPKRHLPRGFLFRSIHSPPLYACMS
jgi:hypothetical protein